MSNYTFNKKHSNLISILLIVICFSILFCGANTLLVHAEGPTPPSENIVAVKEQLNFDTFDNINYFIKQSNDFYLVDSINSKIIKTNAENTTTFDSTNIVDTNTQNPILKPKFINYTINDSIILYDNAINNNPRRVRVFNSDFSSCLNTYEQITNELHIENLSDLCVDYFGNIFAIDIDNQMILKKDVNCKSPDLKCNFLTEFYSNNEFIFTENSKIAVSLDGSILALANLKANKILILNNNVLTEIDIDFSVDNLKFDCSNNLIVFSKIDETSSKITKLNKNDYATSTFKIIPSTFSDVYLDTESGDIFYLTTSGIYKINNHNLTDNTINFPSPINYNENVALLENAKIITITTETKLLNSPNSVTSNIILPINTKLILLSNNIENYENFAYCRFSTTENDVKKDYNGYILKSAFTVNETTLINEDYKTFFTNVKVYKYPTINSEIIENIDKNISVNVTENVNYLDNNSSEFYGVLYNEKIGYVLKNNLISVSLFESTPVTPESETIGNQSEAFILIIICLFIATGYVIYRINLKDKKSD